MWTRFLFKLYIDYRWHKVYTETLVLWQRYWERGFSSRKFINFCYSCNFQKAMFHIKSRYNRLWLNESCNSRFWRIEIIIKKDLQIFVCIWIITEHSFFIAIQNSRFPCFHCVHVFIIPSFLIIMFSIVWLIISISKFEKE